MPKVGAGHAEGGQWGVQGKRRVFEGAPNGSQGGVKGDQGNKWRPREKNGGRSGTIALPTSNVLKYFRLRGSVDDVDLEVSNGDSNFEHNLEYGRGQRGATHISGTAKLSARLVELGAPCAQAATLTDS